MRSKNENLQELVRKYQQASQPWPASPRDIAQWAISHRFWAPEPQAVVKQCADQISNAMSAEYFTDPQGRRVRAKHAVVSQDGEKQTSLWDDIRTAEPRHIEVSAQQRRGHIIAECKQLKTDIDSFNENRNPERPINMVFDFTLDLEEAELARMKRHR